MSRYFLEIEFNGAEFSGWQLQPDTKTVEGSIEDALATIFQQSMDIVGQGRTDAGVHARAQVAHVDISDECWVRIQKNCATKTELMNLLVHRLNRMLGPNIFIRGMQRVAPDAHARFTARTRSYEYRVLLASSPIDAKLAWYPGFEPIIVPLQILAKQLIGVHDFDVMSKTNPDNFTTICSIEESQWVVQGNVLVYRISANRFLRNMVRRLVGTMVQLSREFELEEYVGLFDRTLGQPIWIHQLKEHQQVTAPAEALTLVKVDYPNDIFVD